MAAHNGIPQYHAAPEHLCTERCPACDVKCNQPNGHRGSHNGTHGPMLKAHFVAGREDMELESQKIVEGQSGRNERCDEFCRKVGRGHVHILYCNPNKGSQCTTSSQDGRRHETQKYGPDKDIPKDELTHDCYWKTIGWKDPCTANEQKEFSWCRATCAHKDHLQPGSRPSFCTLPLWHDPMSEDGPGPRTASGHVAIDGHHYVCKHNRGDKFHVLMVLDESGSMVSKWGNLVAAVKGFVARRLQATTQDLLSIVHFAETGRLIAEGKRMVDCQSIQLNRSGGGTNFTEGLKVAQDVMKRVRESHPLHRPLLLFLSDGECSSYCNGGKEMQDIGQDFSAHGLIVYTVGFGEAAGHTTLQYLATLVSGTFLKALDGVELQATFDKVASNMSEIVALVPEESTEPPPSPPAALPPPPPPPKTVTTITTTTTTPTETTTTTKTVVTTGGDHLQEDLQPPALPLACCCMTAPHPANHLHNKCHQEKCDGDLQKNNCSNTWAADCRKNSCCNAWARNQQRNNCCNSWDGDQLTYNCCNAWGGDHDIHSCCNAWAGDNRKIRCCNAWGGDHQRQHCCNTWCRCHQRSRGCTGCDVDQSHKCCKACCGDHQRDITWYGDQTRNRPDPWDGNQRDKNRSSVWDRDCERNSGCSAWGEDRQRDKTWDVWGEDRIRDDRQGGRDGDHRQDRSRDQQGGAYKRDGVSNRPDPWSYHEAGGQEEDRYKRNLQLSVQIPMEKNWKISIPSPDWIRTASPPRTPSSSSRPSSRRNGRAKSPAHLGYKHEICGSGIDITLEFKSR